MAAVAKLRIILDIEGLENKYSFDSETLTLVGVPAEVFEGKKAIIGATTVSLDLGTIAPADLLGVLIYAVVGNVGILVNSVDGTPSATVGNQLLKTGEACFINVAGGLTDATYNIRLTGSAATTAIKYAVFGK